MYYEHAYELHAMLTYLTMVEVNGEIEWMGTAQDWRNANNLIRYFETYENI